MANNRLRPVAQPRLPSAPIGYAPQYHEQYSNVLRLFFDRLINTVSAVIGRNGGQYVECPNGLFFNTGEQLFAAINTAYPVVFNQTYLDNAVGLQTGSTSRIQVTVSGVYNFQYTGQVLSTNSSAKNIYLWLRRNGITIGYSTRVRTVAANNQSSPIAWNFNIDMQAGDYMELVASVTDTNLHLHAEAAAGAHPGIPSSVLTVNYISPLPDTLPTPP